MGKINLGRVVLGGIIAGVVINAGEFLLNTVILAKEWEEAMKSLNKGAMSNEAMVYFILAGFVLGLLAVYLYAAIRPRFGAGAKTAICAGLLVWAFAYLYGTLAFAGMGLFPTRMLLYGLIWGIFEAPIATVIGAWPYKEE